MTRRKSISLSLILAGIIALSGASPPQAQIMAYENSPWEWNVNSGIQTTDDAGTNFILGTRLMYNYSNGAGWGGNFSWVPVDGDNLFLYSAELDYSFSLSDQWVYIIGGGLGASSANSQNGHPHPRYYRIQMVSGHQSLLEFPDRGS